MHNASHDSAEIGNSSIYDRRPSVEGNVCASSSPILNRSSGPSSLALEEFVGTHTERYSRVTDILVVTSSVEMASATDQIFPA